MDAPGDAPAPRAPPPDASVSFETLAGPRVPLPESIAQDAFFDAPAAPRRGPPPAEALPRRPLAFGALLMGVGFLGTLVFAASFLHQLVIGAPVFEELWKFGTALVLVALLRVRWTPLRVLVALVPGIGFGVMEHYLTYPDESLVVFVDRIVFHSGATALSMAVYSAVEPVWDERIRWISTVPATVVHWLNNFLAFFFGVGSLVAGALETVMLGIAFALGLVTHALAWGVVAAPTRARLALAREWFRRAPPASRPRVSRTWGRAPGAPAPPAASPEATAGADPRQAD